MLRRPLIIINNRLWKSTHIIAILYYIAIAVFVKSKVKRNLNNIIVWSARARSFVTEILILPSYNNKIRWNFLERFSTGHYYSYTKFISENVFALQIIIYGYTLYVIICITPVNWLVRSQIIIIIIIRIIITIFNHGTGWYCTRTRNAQ